MTGTVRRQRRRRHEAQVLAHLALRAQGHRHPHRNRPWNSLLGGVEDEFVQGVKKVSANVETLVLAEGELLVQRDVHDGNSVVTQRREPK